MYNNGEEFQMAINSYFNSHAYEEFVVRLNEYVANTNDTLLKTLLSTLEEEIAKEWLLKINGSPQ